ncbi:NADH-quinone oxidoreductase subunit C [Salisaeta longa]|uniref:NADH-quinone oxidoreductase subunit C n=1 Tax=Salisaeta longa TaxID=503170 RepID=UPI0003B4A964|nr:NADH-quinone oxidoreductase subunit C [Salisaeta longa]
MPADDKRATPPPSADAGPENLKFYYTPTDEARPDQDEGNPHAQGTTHVPEVIDALRDTFGDAVVLRAETYANEDTVFIAKDEIANVCRYLKAEQGFLYFVDCGGIDRFTEDERFEMFYNLVNIDDVKRLRLKVRIDEDDLHVPSVTPVYRAANWNEREAYDMFGLIFDGHPDLRRMYMPEDFEYYPLRKEFPQLGIPGSLPLPPQTPEGPLTMDPFAAAHGSKPVKSYEEPTSDFTDEDVD